MKKINWHDVAEAIGCAFTILLFALLAWLFLIATPDQQSAECDYWTYRMEAKPL